MSLRPSFGCAVAMLLASAVAVPARAQLCAPMPRALYEHEVTDVARYAGDSALRPRPAEPASTASDASSAFVVQFVVDTLGRPQPQTLQILRAPTPADRQAVTRILPRWRFTPARVDRCVVAQLVQTRVER